MVRIRLSRHGRRNAPSFRIIVVDSHKKRDGRYLERLGHYNPSEDDKKFVIDQERYKYWLSVGAQPSESVVKIINGKYNYKKYNPNAKEEDTKESEVKAEDKETETQEEQTKE